MTTVIEVKRYKADIAAAKADIADAMAALEPLRQAHAAATAKRKRLQAEAEQARLDVHSFESDPRSEVTADRYTEARATLARSNMLIQLAAKEERDAGAAHNIAEFKAYKLSTRRQSEALQGFEDDVKAIRQTLKELL